MGKFYAPWTIGIDSIFKVLLEFNALFHITNKKINY